jgi:hypothetical protein
MTNTERDVKRNGMHVRVNTEDVPEYIEDKEHMEDSDGWWDFEEHEMEGKEDIAIGEHKR